MKTKKRRMNKFRASAVVGVVFLTILSAQWGVCQETAKHAIRLSEEFAQLAEKVSPSVVHISTVRVIRSGGPQGGMPPQLPEFFDDGLLERFFRFRPPQQERRRPGLGSGVIVSPDGYVITNNHVIEGAEEMNVIMADKREFDAEVVGTDPETDIAVLKIDAEGLPAVEFGDSNDIQVGHFVLAIGSPFGLHSTVSSGIISAKGRANIGITEYEDFIQTDAAINPGNSGGPLVDMNGKLIGINTAIFSRTGGNLGVGFAVPINMVKAVMNSIIEQGHVTRGWLGVSIQNLTPELAETLGIDRTDGALVADVVPDSPASQAGFERGDLIIEVNGEEVANSNELRNKVANLPPGKTSQITVLRDGDRKRISVTIGQRPTQVAKGKAIQEDLGFQLMNLTDEVRERFQIPDNVDGVLVAQVAPGSDAHQAGLRTGAVITEVNRQTVQSVEEFNRIFNQVESGKNVLMLVYYQGGTVYMVIPKPE